MDEQLKKAKELFYKHEYQSARNIFIALDLPYETGLCSFMLKNLSSARKSFEIKKDICPASRFGITIIDILEHKETEYPHYFQVRSFLETYLNLFIENKFYEWAQKIIDNYEIFMKNNLEVPKFIARVLEANNQLRAVHSFANLGKKICFYDAEVHYVDALVYISEGNYDKAKECIEDCLSFAKEYYPILRLQNELNEITSK